MRETERRRAAKIPSMPSHDVYFSADVEADGPIPGVNSMLSFGFSLAGVFDGDTFRRIDPARHTFYRELRPISDEFDVDAVAVSGLDRDELLRSGADPTVALSEAADWVRALTTQIDPAGRPVFVAYPLGFDWMFLYWYLVRFSASGSPFGFSGCLDIKTLYAIRARTTIGASTKSQMPTELHSTRTHTHNALDDAIEQAELFQNLFTWEGA